MGRMVQGAQYGLLAVAVFTVFLPLMSIQAPVVGKIPISVSGMVSQMFSSGTADSKTDNTPMSQLKDKSKEVVGDLGGIMKKLVGDLNVHSEKPIYWVIIASFVAGALAHLLLPVILVTIFLGRYRLTTWVSVGAFLFSVYFCVGIFLTNNLIHTSLTEAVGVFKTNPFAGLANVLTQGIEVRTEVGLYVLVAATLSLFVTGWLRNRIC